MKYILITLLIGFLSNPGLTPAIGLQQSQEITEVTLEMNPGSSPSARNFRIVLRSDGTALYEGKANVKLKGKYQGLLPREDFAQLVNFIREHHFSDLRTSFSKAAIVSFSSQVSVAFASPTVSTSIVQDTKRHTIERPVGVKINSPQSPPKDLLAIENAITTIATRIKWAKIKK